MALSREIVNNVIAFMFYTSYLSLVPIILIQNLINITINPGVNAPHKKKIPWGAPNAAVAGKKKTLTPPLIVTALTLQNFVWSD